jgi:transposase
MLVELSMVEQRYDAVQEVLDGATVIDVATRGGIDRRTLHRWLVRYASEGLAALADRSSKPDRCPHQIAPEVEARIVELRRAHPGWGPRTILNKLRRELEAVPSRSAMYRCLVRLRLIEPKPRRRRRDHYKRWERSRSMELWQLDVMGSVFLRNGIGVSVVTGIDDHSRFCVIAKVVVRNRSSGLRGAAGRVEHPRHSRTNPDGQWQGLHREAGEKARQRAVRPHLSQQRDPPPPHGSPFADDHGKDRALAQDHCARSSSPTRASIRSTRCRPLSTRGSWTTTTSASTGPWVTWPIRRFELARAPMCQAAIRPSAKSAWRCA